MSIIYGLLDDDGSVRYVGATVLSLKLRTMLHWRQRNRSNSPSRRWLQSRITMPRSVILEVCKTGYESETEAEARWIAYYGLENLLNVVAAGYKFESQYHQIDPVSEAERRRKIGIASTGVCHMTEEGKKRGALKRTGVKRSPEARQKMRDAALSRRKQSQCPYCDKIFNGVRDCNQHQAEEHQRVTIQCLTCQRSFKNLRAYKIHKRRSLSCKDKVGDSSARS